MHLELVMHIRYMHLDYPVMPKKNPKLRPSLPRHASSTCKNMSEVRHGENIYPVAGVTVQFKCLFQTYATRIKQHIITSTAAASLIQKHTPRQLSEKYVFLPSQAYIFKLTRYLHCPAGP